MYKEWPCPCLSFFLPPLTCPSVIFPHLPASSRIFPHLPSSSVASLLLFPSSPLRPCPLLSLLSPPPPSRLCTPSLLPSPSLLTVPSPFFHPSSSLSLLTPSFPVPFSPFPAPCHTVQNFQICHSRLCWQNCFKTKKNKKQN